MDHYDGEERREMPTPVVIDTKKQQGQPIPASIVKDLRDTFGRRLAIISLVIILMVTQVLTYRSLVRQGEKLDRAESERSELSGQITESEARNAAERARLQNQVTRLTQLVFAARGDNRRQQALIERLQLVIAELEGTPGPRGADGQDGRDGQPAPSSTSGPSPASPRPTATPAPSPSPTATCRVRSPLTGECIVR